MPSSPQKTKGQRKKILKESIISMTEDEQVNWHDVRKKVADGDITYTLALALAQKKIEEYEDIDMSEKAIRYMSIFNVTRIFAHLCLGVYMLLSFFQKPAWCMQKPLYDPEQNLYYDNCAGTVLEGTVIPVSDLPYLPNWLLLLIELFCVTFLTLRKYLQQTVEKRLKRRFRLLVVVTVLVYIADIVQYTLNLPVSLNQFLRPVYMVTYIPAIKTNLLLYIRLFWKSREIFVTIAGAFLFYVCIGRIFFYQTAQNTPGTANFDTFPNTLYNLFVSLTTSNYPDVMMPIYKEYRGASVYFILFMSTVGIVLLNIILAYFYYNYKKDLLSQAVSFQRKQLYYDIINEPDHEEEHHEDQEHHEPHDVTKKTLTNPDKSLNESELFLDEIQSIKEEDRDQLFEGSRWRRILLEALDLFNVRTVFALGSLLAFLLVVIEVDEVSPDPDIEITADVFNWNNKFDHYWVISEFAINCFLLLDPFFRVIAAGWRYFWKSKFLVFDFILSMVILFLLSITLFVSSSFNILPVKIILIFRVCRFLVWVNSFEKYKLIFNTINKLIPLFADLLGVLFFAFYIYSTIGTTMFGGYVKTNVNWNFGQAGDPQYYVYVNFNDFYMGMFTCFHLLIVNNWLYTVDVHCKIMGSYLYRIFFVSFYILTVMICLNIMISFILDIFVVQIGKQYEKYHPMPTLEERERRLSAKLERRKSATTPVHKPENSTSY